MSLWSTITPCSETRECHYQEIFHNKKCCRILNSDKDGKPPYRDGECPFWKKPKIEKP